MAETVFEESLFMLRLLLTFFATATMADGAIPLGEETFGNAPLNRLNFTEWPNVMQVVNDSHRVYHSWVNGNENCYFQGDTASLNSALKEFSKIEAEKLVVVLRPAPATISSFKRDRTFEFNWQLHLLGGIAKHMATRDQGSLVWDPAPELTVYVGGAIELDQLEVPANVEVRQVSDLKQQYLKALSSTDQTVRGWTCGAIAALDRHDDDSMHAIAELLKDNEVWVRINAAGALAEFAPQRAKVIPILESIETEDEDLKTRIATTIQKLNTTGSPSVDRKSYSMRLKQISEYVESRQLSKR